MSRREQARFAPNRRPVAFHADLFGMLFGGWEPPAPFELVGDTAIVTVRGPMTHHDEYWWDSYDSIAHRFDLALASPAGSVLLRIDSPGGVVSGGFELSRSLRTKAAAAGKRFVAYADGMAASGGYALASAAPEVYAPATATLGSIGVVVAVVDEREADAQYGQHWHLFASGSQKADGNPHTEVTPEVAARFQAEVDELAELFFVLVAENRSLPVDAVRALEAGTVFGARAKGIGLIDQVMTLDDVLAMLAGGHPPQTQKETNMGWKDDMKKAADDGDEEAKKCSAALEDGGTEEQATDDPPKEGDGKDKDKDKPGASKASAARPKLSMEARLQLLEERDEKLTLIATRPDLPTSLRSKLEGQPLSAVRFAVSEFPKVKPAAAAPTTPTPPVTTPATHAAAAAAVGSTGTQRLAKEMLGEGTDEDDIDSKIDKKMGLAAPKARGFEFEGNVIRLGSITPEAARVKFAEIQAAEAAGKRVLP